MSATSEQAPLLSRVLRVAAAPFLIGAASAGLCYAAAGLSLGFYLGGVGMTTIVLPMLVARERRGENALLAGGAVIDGIGLAWLAGVLAGGVSVWQWLGCYATLGAYGAALGAIAWPVRGRWSMIRPAVAVIAGGLWLTWPIWLARGPDWCARWLVPIHPLFAINGLLADLGIWLQQSIIYRHVALGQDVAYVLPRTPFLCIFAHLLLSSALVLASTGRSRG